MLLIDLCGSKALDRWVREVVGETDGWTLVFRMLAEPFPCHHNWNRGFGDEVVGEGAKNNAASHVSRQGMDIGE
jgi:hypothetical protein